MNEYIIPFHDIQADSFPKFRKIVARSLTDCKEKLMEQLLSEYDELMEFDTYDDFRKYANEQDISIGEITDKEIL